MISYDPYDIWSTKFLGRLKVLYTEGKLFSKIIVLFFGVAELIAPIVLRKLLRVRKSQFAHVEAMMQLSRMKKIDLSSFSETAVISNPGISWGLPFKWYSKNGVYDSNTGYITNTPYVMEALISQNWKDNEQAPAKEMFLRTWEYLQSLKILHENSDELALSYAVIDEPYTVVNANSYSALAYALHAVHGKNENKEVSIIKVTKIINWIIGQQNSDGSWYYYADKQSGNFIDCFHSCFIIKNLIKVKKLLPQLSEIIDPVVMSGWEFIDSNFYDEKKMLCQRFVEKDLSDPFVWDLYDQAEYLGLLVDFGMYEKAALMTDTIEKKFHNNNNWYCRIDFFGRKWGKNFMRWGIVPFFYHRSRLNQALANSDATCVE